MYYDISIKIALIISILALVSNAALCIMKNNLHNVNIISQLKEITLQCRWIGLLFFVFSWFSVNVSTQFQEIAQYMLIVSIGWIVVFVLSSISKFWNSGENFGTKALGMGIMYFILAYLLH